MARDKDDKSGLDPGAGGYDDGYAVCPCFWGTCPGSLLRQLVSSIPSTRGLDVLDLGCGEGKNAFFLANTGARVFAIDISERAIANARRLPSGDNVQFVVGDMKTTRWLDRPYDIVIAYGSLHCLRTEADVLSVLGRIQESTRSNGFNVICAFNDRQQDLAAHPGFSPLLLPHAFYVARYSGWQLLHCSDTDLSEAHPNNGIQHSHSMTRILARKGQDA